MWISVVSRTRTRLSHSLRTSGGRHTHTHTGPAHGSDGARGFAISVEPRGTHAELERDDVCEVRRAYRALEFELLPKLCRRWGRRLSRRQAGKRLLPHIERAVALQPLELLVTISARDFPVGVAPRLERGLDRLVHPLDRNDVVAFVHGLVCTRWSRRPRVGKALLEACGVTVP